MAINRITKSVASRIAKSSSKNIPIRIQTWAQNHIEALSVTSSNTSDETTPDSSTPDIGEALESSSSTLPMLELAFEATKINTHSCLKKKEQYRGRRRHRPTKSVKWVRNDILLTSIGTGAHMLPPPESETKIKEKYDRFVQRSEEMYMKRKEEKRARRLARKEASIDRAEDSSSDEESDNEERNGAADGDDEEEKDIIDPRDSEANVLRERIKEADRASEALTIHTIACGGLDFALYVTRTEDTLESLEKTALYYRKVAKIVSYQGDERTHTCRGVYAETTLGPELYADFGTAMSGARHPAGYKRATSIPSPPVLQDGTDETEEKPEVTIATEEREAAETENKSN
ncbi:hypothetical protein NLG97_g3811 [Lecanicillium saksenae]|uniref:Uncharacterized protein n=1 Tax=Lecanicillium saksenae TaxID=468837 RepID=A0ACC1QY87_9HYPO|nr:hypothetical protein NLG97_g3811 [Lecanicillium saksenae]